VGSKENELFLKDIGVEDDTNPVVGGTADADAGGGGTAVGEGVVVSEPSCFEYKGKGMSIQKKKTQEFSTMM
jgi:hypothetical protein